MESSIHSHKAKKRFGQNFLKDEAILIQIAESASNMFNTYKREYKNLEVVEIGPGLGDLSVKLLDYFNLVAYEIDSELYRYLKTKFSKHNFEIHHKDVLSIKFTKNGWLHEKPYILVSNLPYNIATRIILNALKDTMCKGMIVMTQKEVADKFCANSGESDFCAISVLAQSASDGIEKIVNVPPSAFIPQPKIESSVFCIYKNKNIIQDSFEEMLQIAFSHPRKTISNNLSKIQNLDEILCAMNINKNTRAHQINTLQYHQIFQQILNKGEKNGK